MLVAGGPGEGRGEARRMHGGVGVAAGPWIRGWL